MSYYRLYYSYPQDRHFAGVVDFYAGDDLSAIRKAAGCAPAMTRELWSLGRKVGEFPPAPVE